jgi:hypothetical protein
MLLQRMPALSPDLSSTLFGSPGPLRQILDTVLAFEAGDPAGMSGLPVPSGELTEAYLSALAWTTRTTAPVDSGAGRGR